MWLCPCPDVWIVRQAAVNELPRWGSTAGATDRKIALSERARRKADLRASCILKALSLDHVSDSCSCRCRQSLKIDFPFTFCLRFSGTLCKITLLKQCPPENIAWRPRSEALR